MLKTLCLNVDQQLDSFHESLYKYQTQKFAAKWDID